MRRTCLAGALFGIIPLSAGQSLPMVNLGYELHQAIAYNSTGRYYNFSNIRYAQPPVGKLRFAAPVPPQPDGPPKVDNGSVGRRCPGTNSCWNAVQADFNSANLTGQPFDFDAAIAQELNSSCVTTVPPQDPTTSEDCLFLDVMVPDGIFDQNITSEGAPVLVWIYGGSKTYWGNPAGLLASSRAADPNSDGVIFVAFNYRLGTLGFMAGQEFSQSGGLVNAGLYDQRLALEWIQQNIHLFGGDPNRVTVMGQSGGGSSIWLQALHEPAVFTQAIAQSPAWLPDTSPSQQDENYKTFLTLIGASNLEEARNATSEAVIKANYFQIARAAFGQYPFGPVIDGLFLPDDPHRLVLEGRFNRNVKFITSFNGNEGLIFAPPNVSSDAAFSQFVSSYIPEAGPALLNYITTELYPSRFDGSLPYSTQLERAQLLFAELVIICNAPALNQASSQPSYAYSFDVFPGAHGQDIPYTLFNGVGSEGPSSTYNDFNVTIAEIMQGYFTSFAMTGDPNAGNAVTGAPYFQLYNAQQVLQLSSDGISLIPNPTVNRRCDFWQSALYH